MFDILREMIDRLERQAEQLGNERAMRTLAEEKVRRCEITGESVVELLGYMAADRKIEAIKLYRQMTGHGLKESKDAVERVTDRFRPLSAVS